MKRTRLLEELLMIRFEEAYEGWQERRLTQKEAARLLDVSERTIDAAKKKIEALCRRPTFLQGTDNNLNELTYNQEEESVIFWAVMSTLW